MNKKPYWFYLFSIYISFYIISCLFLMLDIFKENAEIYTVLGASVLLSLIGLLFFTPTLILVSFIVYKVKHKAIYNVINFGIVYFYGYIFLLSLKKNILISHITIYLFLDQKPTFISLQLFLVYYL